jgi:hypothetical protein
MARFVFKIALMGIALLSTLTAAADPRATVDAFGAALVLGNADELRTVLPTEGKVRVHLMRLGPQEGAVRGGQLHAVLQDFLENANVQSFKLQTIEYTDRLALASARMDLVDQQGRANVRLHLALEPEGDHWVLREIRESRR